MQKLSQFVELVRPYLGASITQIETRFDQLNDCVFLFLVAPTPENFSNSQTLNASQIKESKIARLREPLTERSLAGASRSPKQNRVVLAPGESPVSNCLTLRHVACSSQELSKSLSATFAHEFARVDA